MTYNGEFSQKSGLDWLKMANFGHFASFPIFHPKWGSDWLEMANFTWFTTFPIFCHQSISFLEKFKKCSLWGEGGTSAIFQLFELFPTKVAQNDTQWPILPPKWFGLAQNFNFFQVFPQKEAQIALEWPISPNLQLFQSFPTKASHFWRGGGTLANFPRFATFWIIFNQSGSKWPTMTNLATKVAGIGSKWAILVKFQQKLKFFSGILTDLHRTFRTGLVFLSRLKWVQGVLCYNQN